MTAKPYSSVVLHFQLEQSSKASKLKRCETSCCFFGLVFIIIILVRRVKTGRFAAHIHNSFGSYLVCVFWGLLFNNLCDKKI